MRPLTWLWQKRLLLEADELAMMDKMNIEKEEEEQSLILLRISS